MLNGQKQYFPYIEVKSVLLSVYLFFISNNFVSSYVWLLLSTLGSWSLQVFKNSHTVNFVCHTSVANGMDTTKNSAKSPVFGPFLNYMCSSLAC